MNEYETSLAHFGVKGMKWGRRKADSDEPKESFGGRQLVNKVEMKATSQARAKKLTDKELQAAVKRLDMEKKYIELTDNTNNISVMNDVIKGVAGITLAVTGGIMAGGGPDKLFPNNPGMAQKVAWAAATATTIGGLVGVAQNNKKKK